MTIELNKLLEYLFLSIDHCDVNKNRVRKRSLPDGEHLSRKI